MTQAPKYVNNKKSTILALLLWSFVKMTSSWVGNIAWILGQIEKNHEVELPQNLIEQEISILTQNLKPDEKEKNKINNEKLAKSRIKLGLLLNEYG